MQWVSAICVLAVTVHLVGGATKAPGASGISQFWTDDYKVFEQIYGKTSDKEIYGDTLPASISYGADARHQKHAEASEKKERYIENDGQNADLNDDFDPYSFGNRYNNLLTKQSLKQFPNIKSTKSPLKYLSSDYKPITKSSDPETYNYLKHLEELAKQKVEHPEPTGGGFKPYVNYVGPNPEDAEGYKSIQDILDAHEANKGNHKGNDNVDEQVKYVTYPPKGRGRSKKQSNRFPGNEKSKVRCPSGRCRKRATNSYRVYTRPYVRRIKHKIVY